MVRNKTHTVRTVGAPFAYAVETPATGHSGNNLGRGAGLVRMVPPPPWLKAVWNELIPFPIDC